VVAARVLLETLTANKKEIMKSIMTALAICALLAGTTQIIAQDETNKDTSKDQSSGLKSQDSKEIKATVEKVDKDTREVTLKKEDGSTVSFKAPDAVRNFDQIKVGDIVTAKYSESVAVSVRKSDEPPSATGRETGVRAPLGEKPAAAGKKTIQITATVKKIDRDTREVTLLGPEGNTRVVKVPEDNKKFDELKEGDQVVITATESVAISVSSPEK
jgi:Cu/Ag efflux protein CusF